MTVLPRAVQPGPVFLGCLGTTSGRPEVSTALQSQPPPPTALTVGLPSLGICSWRSQVTQKKKRKLRAHNLGAQVCVTDAAGWTTFPSLGRAAGMLGLRATFPSLGFSSSALHPLTPHRFLLFLAVYPHSLQHHFPSLCFFPFFSFSHCPSLCPLLLHHFLTF